MCRARGQGRDCRQTVHASVALLSDLGDAWAVLVHLPLPAWCPGRSQSKLWVGPGHQVVPDTKVSRLPSSRAQAASGGAGSGSSWWWPNGKEASPCPGGHLASAEATALQRIGVGPAPTSLEDPSCFPLNAHAGRVGIGLKPAKQCIFLHLENPPRAWPAESSGPPRGSRLRGCLAHVWSKVVHWLFVRFVLFFFLFLDYASENSHFYPKLRAGRPPPLAKLAWARSLTRAAPAGGRPVSELLASALLAHWWLLLRCGGLSPCVLSCLTLWSCVVSSSLAGSALKRLCLGKEHSSRNYRFLPLVRSPSHGLDCG